ncbi:hypothetical protein BG842_09730 [Haladaptatus sp. W1]|nr:hypothetical protein BG842_09730 [Haladaptatus sp. W1]
MNRRVKRLQLWKILNGSQLIGHSRIRRSLPHSLGTTFGIFAIVLAQTWSWGARKEKTAVYIS